MINKLFDIPSFSLFNNYEMIAKIKYKVNEIIDTINNTPAPAPSGSVNYSTDEQECGTWIDDLPLYQKTYNITFVNDDTENLIGDDMNIIDKIISLEGYIDTTEDSEFSETPLPTTIYGTATNSKISFTFDKTHGLTCAVGSSYEGIDAVITIKYTKRII